MHKAAGTIMSCVITGAVGPESSGDHTALRRVAAARQWKRSVATGLVSFGLDPSKLTELLPMLHRGRRAKLICGGEDHPAGTMPHVG